MADNKSTLDMLFEGAEKKLGNINKQSVGSAVKKNAGAISKYANPLLQVGAIGVQLKNASDEKRRLLDRGLSETAVRDILLRKYGSQIVGQLGGTLAGAGLGALSVASNRIPVAGKPISKTLGALAVSAPWVGLTAGYNKGNQLAEDYINKTYPDIKRRSDTYYTQQGLQSQLDPITPQEPNIVGVQPVAPVTSTVQKPNIPQQSVNNNQTAPSAPINDFINNLVKTNGLEKDKQIAQATSVPQATNTQQAVDTMVGNQDMADTTQQTNTQQLLTEALGGLINKAITPIEYPQYNASMDLARQARGNELFRQNMAMLGHNVPSQAYNPLEAYNQDYELATANQLGMPLNLAQNQRREDLSSLETIYKILNNENLTDVERTKAENALVTAMIKAQTDEKKRLSDIARYDADRLSREGINQVNNIVDLFKLGQEIPIKQMNAYGNLASGASFIQNLLTGAPQKQIENINSLQALGYNNVELENYKKGLTAQLTNVKQVGRVKNPAWSTLDYLRGK